MATGWWTAAAFFHLLLALFAPFSQNAAGTKKLPELLSTKTAASTATMKCDTQPILPFGNTLDAQVGDFFSLYCAPRSQRGGGVAWILPNGTRLETLMMGMKIAAIAESNGNGIQRIGDSRNSTDAPVADGMPMQNDQQNRAAMSSVIPNLICFHFPHKITTSSVVSMPTNLFIYSFPSRRSFSIAPLNSCCHRQWFLCSSNSDEMMHVALALQVPLLQPPRNKCMFRLNGSECKRRANNCVLKC